MRPTVICPAACVLAALAAAQGRGAEAPCYCLQDAADRIWYGCTTRDVGTNPLHDCYPSGAKERREVLGGHTLTRIEGGTPPCKPCRRGAPGAHQALRPRDAGDNP
jgi:hypothetical protein